MKKSLIQRGESVVRRVRIFSEMFFYERRILGQRGREIFNARTAADGLDVGKLGAEKSIHKHQPMAGQLVKNRFRNQLGLGTVDGDLSGERERQLRDGRDIREAPVFIAQLRETHFRETGDACFTHRREPFRLRRRFRL